MFWYVVFVWMWHTSYDEVRPIVSVMYEGTQTEEQCMDIIHANIARSAAAGHPDSTIGYCVQAENKIAAKQIVKDRLVLLK